MLMIDSIEFHIRCPFSDVKPGVPCFQTNERTNENGIAGQNIVNASHAAGFIAVQKFVSCFFILG